jgi:hypothetical protein
METVPVSVQVHRFDVLGALLEAGIPPNKIKKKKLRRLLEKGSGKLTSPAHLILTYLPQVALKEFKKIKKEVGDRPIGVYHDGTTEEGEAFCIIFRHINDDMKPETRAVEVERFKSCLSNQHVSAALVKCICVTFGFLPARVMSGMHDRCGVNGASFRITLSGVFIGSDDNDCMGHTCMHVGEPLGTYCLDDVLAPYNAMNGNLLYFRKSFVRKTDITPKKTSSTRWYGDIDAIDCLEVPLGEGTFVLVFEDMVKRDF